DIIRNPPAAPGDQGQPPPPLSPPKAFSPSPQAGPFYVDASAFEDNVLDAFATPSPSKTHSPSKTTFYVDAFALDAPACECRAGREFEGEAGTFERRVRGPNDDEVNDQQATTSASSPTQCDNLTTNDPSTAHAKPDVNEQAKYPGTPATPTPTLTRCHKGAPSYLQQSHSKDHNGWPTTGTHGDPPRHIYHSSKVPSKTPPKSPAQCESEPTARSSINAHPTTELHKPPPISVKSLARPRMDALLEQAAPPIERPFAGIISGSASCDRQRDLGARLTDTIISKREERNSHLFKTHVHNLILEYSASATDAAKQCDVGQSSNRDRQTRPIGDDCDGVSTPAAAAHQRRNFLMYIKLGTPNNRAPEPAPFATARFHGDTAAAAIRHIYELIYVHGDDSSGNAAGQTAHGEGGKRGPCSAAAPTDNAINREPSNARASSDAPTEPQRDPPPTLTSQAQEELRLDKTIAGLSRLQEALRHYAQQRPISNARAWLATANNDKQQ
ncbi:unnamed protein product, partial [Prorocentrum cordatum]